MSLTKEQILDAVANMSVMDIVELTSMMEKKFGVSARTEYNSDSVPVKSTTQPIIDEQTEFNVLLTAIGANKIPVIKAVRSITNLGLKEAKELVESTPIVLKELISKDDAEIIKKTLESVGASVEIK